MRTIALMFLMLASAAAAEPQAGLQFLDRLSAIATETSRAEVDESVLSSFGILSNGEVSKKGLAGMRAVHLRTYEMDSTAKRIDSPGLRKELESGSWTQLLQNDVSDGKNEVWIHKTESEIDGMLLISTAGGKLRVISIDGVSRAEGLKKVASSAGVR